MQEFWNEFLNDRQRDAIIVALIATIICTVLVGCLVGVIAFFTAGMWYFGIPCAVIMLFALILAVLLGP